VSNVRDSAQVSNVGGSAQVADVGPDAVLDASAQAHRVDAPTPAAKPTPKKTRARKAKS
jgi:hypothetical protein